MFIDVIKKNTIEEKKIYNNKKAIYKEHSYNFIIIQKFHEDMSGIKKLHSKFDFNWMSKQDNFP